MFAQNDETRGGRRGAGRRARCARRAMSCSRARRHPSAAVLPTRAAHPRRSSRCCIMQIVLSHGECARARPRLRSRSSAASQQSHRDGLMPTALVNGRVLSDRRLVERSVRAARGGAHRRYRAERRIRAARARAGRDLRGSCCCRDSSTRRSTAAAACCSTMRPASSRSAPSARRIGASARPDFCRR